MANASAKSKSVARDHGAKVIRNRTEPVMPSGTGDALYGNPGAGKTLGEIVRRSNLWRDNYNPLRSLTLRKLMALFEEAERGATAEIQLVIRKVKKRYPILKGFIEKLLSSVEQLNWDVKVMQNLPPGATPEMAETQRTFLKSRYELLQNFNESLGQLALAEIHGYTVLQKHRYDDGPNDGAVQELYWIEPWCWARNGYYGDFYYNEISRFGVGLGSCASTLGENNRIGSDSLPREDFVIKECETPIYEIALIAFVNWLMGRKDWAAFVEIFGLPNGVVIMPPNIPKGQESEYQTSAEKVSDGISGALPPGSDIKFPTASVRGEAPMEKFCSAQDSDVVLAATGGELTMISRPTGIGKGASEEHDAAWQTIAAQKARRINEILHRDFDAIELAAQFPGQPVCVYFELAVQDEADVKETVDTVVALDGIGMQADVDEVSERTGLKLTRVEISPQNQNEIGSKVIGSEIGQALRNRSRKPEAGSPNAEDVGAFAAAVSDDVAPVLARLQAISEIKDDAIFEAKLKQFHADFPQLQSDVLKDPSADRALLPIITRAFLGGLQNEAVKNRLIKNGGAGSGDFGHAGRGGEVGGSAPARISTEEADRLLTEGFTENDREGRAIKFGTRYKQHTEAHPNPLDVKDRKERLNWSRETVRSGARVEQVDPKTGKLHAYYSKYFSDGNKDKGFVSMVDVQDGEAFSGFRAPRNYIGKLGNRRDESGEQPPLTIWQTIAAAGGLPDWFKFNPEEKIVKT